jgi:hypothetical protein
MFVIETGLDCWFEGNRTLRTHITVGKGYTVPMRICYLPPSTDSRDRDYIFQSDVSHRIDAPLSTLLVPGDTPS